MYKGIALTIGGSDSGGGAGIQADLKTFMSLEVHGCSAITCITSQNSIEVKRVDSLPPKSITSQIKSVLDDFNISALKTGMLLNRELVETTAECLNKINISILIDPVMVSRTGSILIEKDAIEAYKKLLITEGELITPNIYEASLLSNIEINDAYDIEKAALALLQMGAKAILVKGGGLKNMKGKDYLMDLSGKGVWLSHNSIDTKNTHGSGCTLSAAITAYRARNLNLKESIIQAKIFIEDAITNSYKLGKGPGTLCHWNWLKK